ncbi:MAG: discoidin domain-containing protein [Anaerolineae bacterium]|nr:discoidin domain-containing protein [Anaerolineae bacterium]
MPDIYPPYIFGMHDRGGEHLMLGKNKLGWVLVTEEVGADPNNHGGNSYTDLSNRGLGVLVRINHGYGSAGAIPYASHYDNFAKRCGNFVQASSGCHIWIIGNEMNLAYERPGNNNGQGGEVITPQRYAACYTKCRTEIRRRPGHENDQVVVGAVGPYNIQTTYPGNPTGDFQKYLADILDLIDQVDGIALHAYTHGHDPNLVFSDAKMMDARVKHLHNEFRVYRDFLAAIPDRFRDRPVYITETDQYIDWKDVNSGWVRNAYLEIDNWNKNEANQPIQALILYRWVIGNPNDPKEVGWAIENKPGVQDDFRDAMSNNYQIVLPRDIPVYKVVWLSAPVPGRIDPGTEAKFAVTVRNDGRGTWANSGARAVKLGYRWIDAGGAATQWVRTPLPKAVPANETVTVPQVAVRPPDKPGFYTLELDMVEGASTWFAKHGSPTKRVGGIQVGPRYRATWLSIAAPAAGTVGQTVTFPVKLRNDGADTWTPGGGNPFSLSYKWLDADRKVIVEDGLRTSLSKAVAPGAEITLNAQVQMTAQEGAYILQMDMVHEFVTWFQGRGSPPGEAQVQVKPALPDYAAEWLEYAGVERLMVGEKTLAFVKVKNVGAVTWADSGTEPVYLGYRWLDEQDNLVAANPKARKVSQPIEPGATATFRDAPVTAVASPGVYRLVFDLAQGDKWLSASGAAVMEKIVQVTAAPYGVEWQALKPWPAWLLPDAEQYASLRLRNVGTENWPAQGDHPVRLAYHWFTAEASGAVGRICEPWDTFRIPLPNDVGPGADVDLVDVPFKTPAVPGRYILRWDLVHEGVTWFFRQGGAPFEVPVEVSDQALFVPWTATASHNPADGALTLDGNPDTVWDSQANQQPGMWFMVDLGEIRVVNRVKVTSPGRGFPLGYAIKLSENGQAWRLVAEAAQNWRNIDVSFAASPVRYIRVEQTGTPSYPVTWKIGDIAVAIVSPWAAAEASHYTDDAHEAIDANLGTAWNTRAVVQKPGMWFKLDMGSPRTIERVVLQHPKNQQPRGYVIQISTDGQTWQEVARKADNWLTVDVTFPPTEARYIRAETTGTSLYQPWGIADIIVWESEAQWLRGRNP